MLLASALMIVYDHRTLRERDIEISTIKTRIDQQKVLSPAFNDLIRRMRIKDPGDLPFPKKEKLPQDDSEKILPFFQEIAGGSNLTIKSFVPDVESLVSGSQHVIMDVVIIGDFFDFRKFFIKLGELPYFERIERFAIRSVEGKKEINLRLWMAQG
ncbi:MAG: hypothetical protein ABII68_06835 [Pseudomonadota bacterium]